MTVVPVEPSVLDTLRERRLAHLAEMDTLIETRSAERSAFDARTDATDEERAAFAVAEAAAAAEFDQSDAALKELDRRVREEKIRDRRRRVAARAARATAPDVRVGAEPLTYRKDNRREVSYFADLCAALHPKASQHMINYNQRSAEERLRRHASEMDVEMPRREADKARRARKQVEENIETRLRLGMGEPFRRDPFAVEQRVTPNRTDAQGGYFIQLVAA